MVKVCLAYIFNVNGDVLLAKRAAHKHFGGLWEFAGGKIKDNETVAEAIARELLEELCVYVTVEKVFTSYQYMLDDGTVLEFYPCHCLIKEGLLKATEHQALEYVSIEDINHYELAPPDYEALEILRAYERSR
jgi:mutator protein MutT